MFNSFKTLLITISLSFAVFSCNNPVAPEDPNQTGSVQFSFGEKSSQKILGKITETATAVLVSLENSKGESVYQLKKIDLYSFGGVFITQPQELKVDNYKITEFVVIDADNNAIYATPKSGSAMAGLVNHPLPVDLLIQKDNVTNSKLEVLRIDNSTPEDFGYVTFKFEIVETIDFRLAVSAYDEVSGGFLLTDATLEVSYDDSLIHTSQLTATTNRIYIHDLGESSTYLLTVKKSGYATLQKSLTKAELKSYSNTPLVVVLSPENQSELLEDLLVHTSNNESYFMKSDGSGIRKLLNYGYPIWMNGKASIAVQSVDNIYIFKFSDLSLEKTIHLNPSINGFYLCYSDITKKFASIGNQNGFQTIIVTDLSGNATHFTRNYNIGSPATSAVDDWLYFVSAVKGVNNIHRMKTDGTQEEPITDQTDYTYGSFGVSYDGTMIVAPKVSGSSKFLAVITIATKSETLIDVSSIGQEMFGYATISKDMKLIYFTAGLNRNLYSVKTDGTDLKQLTFSDITFHRAKAW